MTFLAGHGEICPPHKGDPHADLQASPQHADPHGLGAFLKRTIQELHVDPRVVGQSAGRHVDHPCEGQISPWPARKVTNCCDIRLNTRTGKGGRGPGEDGRAQRCERAREGSAHVWRVWKRSEIH